MKCSCKRVRRQGAQSSVELTPANPTNAVAPAFEQLGSSRIDAPPADNDLPPRLPIPNAAPLRAAEIGHSRERYSFRTQRRGYKLNNS